MKIQGVIYCSLLLIPLLLSLTACSSKPVVEGRIHEHAVICFDCDYQQAVHYAIEEAHPAIACERSKDPAGLPTHNCRSEPQQVVVYDGVHHQAYGFTLLHSNQGQHRHQLVLQVLDREVHPEAVALLKTAAEARLELQSSMDNIAHELADMMNKEEAERRARMLQMQQQPQENQH